MEYSKYQILKRITNNINLIWKETRGIAPKCVTDKMENAMLGWLVDLTNALQIWIDKGEEMTEGELILARANMGSIVEGWLKIFYCAYYDEYLKNPRKNKRGGLIEPNKMTLESLKIFSIGILWDDNEDSNYLWVEKVQHYRNAIHAFDYRDIGTNLEFIEDIDILYDFVENIQYRLPPLEDCIECYPAGYIINPYF